MKILKSIGGRARFLSGALPVVLLLAPGAAPAQKLDTTQFIAIGEGLAAGMSDFALRDVYQTMSFPAQMAKQMNTAFPMPLIQSPGVSLGTPGFNQLPAGLPFTLQGSGRNDFPPQLFSFNLAMPGATLTDALNFRPASPLIQPGNAKQTLANLVLGYPSLIIKNNVPYWSQVEYANAMNPTLVVVELGYAEVLVAAATNDPTKLPGVATFTSNYATLLSRLKALGPSSPQIVVMTVPNPFDTAYFTSVNQATNFLAGAPPQTIQDFLAVKQGDYFTPNGLVQAVSALITGNVNPFFNPFSALPGTVINAATKTAVDANVTALNAAITAAASSAGATVYDLNALFRQVRQNGVVVTGTQTVTADYLGGFYSLDGYYPGHLGQAVIANGMLTQLNTTYKTNFPMLDLVAIAKADPAGRLKPSAVKKEGAPLLFRGLDLSTRRGGLRR